MHPILNLVVSRKSAQILAWDKHFLAENYVEGHAGS